MIINSKLKLALSAMLLFGSASAYADTATETEVTPVLQLPGIGTNANVQKLDWAGFVNAVNDPSTLPQFDKSLKTAKDNADAALKALPTTESLENTLTQKQAAAKTAQDDYDEINADLTDLNNRLNRMSDSQKYSDQPISWLSGIIDLAETCEEAWQLQMQAETNSGVIYYVKQTVGTRNFLYLSFQEQTVGSSLIISGSTKGSWVKASMSEFDKMINPADGTLTVTTVYVYLGADRLTTSGTAAVATITASASNNDNIIPAAYSALQTQATKEGYFESKPTAAYYEIWDYICDIDGGKKSNGTTVAKAEGTLAIAKAALDAANAAVTAAQTAVIAAPGKQADAQKALTDATTAYNNAVADAQKAINTVTITADFTASTPITADYAGNIHGGNHVITVDITGGTTNGCLFNRFTGTLENTAINGNFRNSATGGTFSHVAVWTGTAARYYNENTTTPTTLDDLYALGMAAREYFGVNLLTGKLAPLGANNANRLYNITVYNVGGQQQHYAQLSGNDFYTAQVGDTKLTKIAIAANTFTESTTSDIAGLDNIIYNGAVNNAVLTDRVALYVPKQVTAKKVTYERTLSGTAAVCLPFALNTEDFKGIKTLGTYDQETADKFWFKNTTEVAANEPALVVMEEGKTLSLDGLKNVTLAATPVSQLVEVNSLTNDGSVAYGLFKTRTSDQFPAGTQGTVYVMTTINGVTEFNPVSSNQVKIPALRMAIYSAIAPGKTAPARQIGFFNEDGVDITDLVFSNDNINSAVEEIEANVNELTIEGGLGEIIFTSDADFGKVAVYSLDGKVAAMANVVAGTTTVSVRNGLYIVNGQKVLVK